MDTTDHDQDLLLNCLAPILSKNAAKELEFVQEMTQVFPNQTTSERLKQIRALRELLGQFPELSLAEIAKVVRKHMEAAQNSPAVVCNRIRERMQNTSSEPVENIETSLKKMSTADLKKVGKSFDLELTGSKAALVENILVWINSGGTIRPKTKAELAAEKAQSFIVRARPLMQNVDPAAADQLLAILREVAGERSMGKEGLEEFLKQLDIPASGSKAQMKKQAEEFIKRLSVTWVQTH